MGRGLLEGLGGRLDGEMNGRVDRRILTSGFRCWILRCLGLQEQVRSGFSKKVAWAEQVGL